MRDGLASRIAEFAPPPQVALAVAILASHLALLVEILRTEGRSGWLTAAMLGATNLAMGLALGRTFRFRRLPVMAIVATTALTEALLWQPASSGRESGWIMTVAVLGLAALVGCWFAMRWADVRFRGRR